MNVKAFYKHQRVFHYYHAYMLALESIKHFPSGKEKWLKNRAVWQNKLEF